MNYLQRKKKAFMAIVNSIKGFVRSISGIPPITLEDCVDDKSVINYQIFGESTQDGEPSPDNPIEVESVGEKTINLWEFDTKEVNTSTNAILFKVTKPITQPCTFYYRNNNYTSDGNVWFISFQSENNSQLSNVFPNHIKQNRVININASEEKPLKTVQIRNGGASYISGGSIDNFMLVEGTYTVDTMPEYEPYGYKIPVTARSEAGESITTNIYLDEPLRKDEYIDFKKQKLYSDETESPIYLSNLPTFKGTTMYEINTTVQPSNMVVQYYSTTKGE